MVGEVKIENRWLPSPFQPWMGRGFDDPWDTVAAALLTHMCIIIMAIINKEHAHAFVLVSVRKRSYRRFIMNVHVITSM